MKKKKFKVTFTFELSDDEIAFLRKAVSGTYREYDVDMVSRLRLDGLIEYDQRDILHLTVLGAEVFDKFKDL